MREIDEFRANLVYVRDLITVAVGPPAIGPAAPDVLRAAYAMAVSALDRYIHEKTLHGMLAVQAGSRPLTPAFERFTVSIRDARLAQDDARVTALAGLTNSVSAHVWLEQAIRAAHSLRSFQKPEPIADAVRSFSSVSLWDSVAARLLRPSDDVKTQVLLIADRRNQIVHEFDCDPTAPGTRWPIDEALVVGSADFVSAVVEAIEAVA